MANSLKTSIRSGMLATLVGDPSRGASTHKISPPADQVLLSGTGNNQANQMFADTRALAASTNEDLDLSGGLSNEFGDSVAFASVKAIRIRAAAGNGGNIVIGGAVANAFVGWFGAAANTIELPAGAEIQLSAPVAGWSITADTGDLLRIANDDAGAQASYDIEIIGTE